LYKLEQTDSIPVLDEVEDKAFDYILILKFNFWLPTLLKPIHFMIFSSHFRTHLSELSNGVYAVTTHHQTGWE